MYRRYALYVTPDEPLATLGAAWLGWDIASGAPVSHPEIEGLDVSKITKRPRKYGLHATIKPPMVLAKGFSYEELTDAAGKVTRSLAPITLDGLHLSRIGAFLALTARGDTTALTAMAATAVKALDPFRAKPSEAELERHRKRTLSPSQENNLKRWGYPYVMDDFRFHITLTGPLKDADATQPLAAAYFAAALSHPFTISHLTLAGEEANGEFKSLAHLSFGG